MPLQDHFRAPLKDRRAWSAVANAWATYMAESLNQRLPDGYFAEPNVQFSIEIDVATWEETGGPARADPLPEPAWSPAAPQLTLPLVVLTDVVEVRIIRNEGGPVLAGAVEVISPANKDRPQSRDAFVSKCASFLQQGVGLIVVDAVTERHANLHRALVAKITPQNADIADLPLYAAAYRPVSRQKQTNVEIWSEGLTIGGRLPTMPLWLRGGICLPLDLETTYARTLAMLKFPSNGDSK